ncbi:MAG: helix-turn-helix transcriptional regulator [Hamadaea sp.]|nr:helix-turn-helix transcriptional regulator [Hamadaea sp.]
MTTTGNPDTTSAKHDIGMLRVPMCDKLASRRGAKTVDEQARLFNCHRSVLYRIRSGECRASLPLALRMSRQLGTTVNRLFVDGS